MLKNLNQKFIALLSFSTLHINAYGSNAEVIGKTEAGVQTGKLFLSDVMLNKYPELKSHIKYLGKDRDSKQYNARDDMYNDPNGVSNRLSTRVKGRLNQLSGIYEAGYMNFLQYHTSQLPVEDKEAIFFAFNIKQQEKDRYSALFKLIICVVLTGVYIGIMHLIYGDWKNIYNYTFSVYIQNKLNVNVTMNNDFSSVQKLASLSKEEQESFIIKYKEEAMFYKIHMGLNKEEGKTLDSIIEKIVKIKVNELDEKEKVLLKKCEEFAKKNNSGGFLHIASGLLMWELLLCWHLYYISFIVRSDVEYTYFFNWNSILLTNLGLFFNLLVTFGMLWYTETLNLQTILFYNLQTVLIQAYIMINWYMKFTQLNERTLKIVKFAHNKKFGFDPIERKITVPNEQVVGEFYNQIMDL